eukprot:CAMPEP_0113467634 /NCGR_PEP_ID=MMETSP0014_2-20120614/14920_1 /TAXON_ID=2857 /ORGANISM="Nitzschia sp." /LENGTH=249 /DNA_ID=CAMNT_0000359957 /DNA_START=484 /DNA_END=1233 /DNA_ORIENTATION=+ /assembly_acc=CAM_ASM_000159
MSGLWYTPKKKTPMEVAQEGAEVAVASATKNGGFNSSNAAAFSSFNCILDRQGALEIQKETTKTQEEATKGDALKLKTQEEATKTELAAAQKEQASKETLQVAKEVKRAEKEVWQAKTQTAKQIKDTSNTFAANGHKLSAFDLDAKSPAKEGDDAESYDPDDLERRLFHEKEDEDKASSSVAKASSSVAKKTPAKKKAPPQPPAKKAAASETAPATPVKKSAGNEKSAPPSALRRSGRKKSARTFYDGN